MFLGVGEKFAKVRETADREPDELFGKFSMTYTVWLSTDPDRVHKLKRRLSDALS
jgi:hypothetical protein